MRYLKTFENYSSTNEEFLGLNKLGENIKEAWGKMKSEFSGSKFVQWTNQNLGSIIESDPEMAKAAANLGIGTKGDVYSQLVEAGKEVKETPEGQKLVAKADTSIEDLQSTIGTVYESFWKSVLKGVLKFVGYAGLIADFCLLAYGWMKAAIGAGFFVSLFGASVSVGVLSVIVCIGLVVFGTAIAIGRSIRIDGEPSDDEAGRW